MEETFDKTPRELTEDLMKMAHEYSILSDELVSIYKTKRTRWMMLRDLATSDRQADKLWEQTTLGMREVEINMRQKSLSREMSAIKHCLRVKENEARNIM